MNRVPPSSPDARILAVRRRGLAAARAVSLTSLTVAALAGCAAVVTPDRPDDGARLADAAPVRDSARAASDAVTADAPDVTTPDPRDSATDASADAGCAALRGTPAYGECCQHTTPPWDWNQGCQAWGPLAPPELDAPV